MTSARRLGKIVGGGFALAAIAGRADIMKHFDRLATAIGNIHFAGEHTAVLLQGMEGAIEIAGAVDEQQGGHSES